MQTLSDVHQQFAEYFNDPILKPYLYALSKKMSEGHICISVGIQDKLELNDAYDQHVHAPKVLVEHPLVSIGDKEYKPFVLYGDKFYMQRYFNYETQLLENIERLVTRGKALRETRIVDILEIKDQIKTLFADQKTPGTNWQLAAAIVAVLNQFTIITGGPGTGKTTTVAKILTILFQLHPEMKIGLAAPTGKAAARMTESLQQANSGSHTVSNKLFESLTPTTIHRLLGWQQDSPYFKYDAQNPLPYDLVLLDESSMIDVAMFAKLLAAIGPDTRLILLGDKDQLASVEAGSLFGDLCKSQAELNVFDESTKDFINGFITDEQYFITQDRVVEHYPHILFQHIVELKYSHRFSAGGAIGQLSKAIIKNDVPVLENYLEQREFNEVLIDEEYSSDVFEAFIKGYESIIDNRNSGEPESIISALNHLNAMRILCATRQGEQGIHQMNKLVENYLIQKKLIRKETAFYQHRPIMVTKNNYTLGLYNGDTGILRMDKEGVLKAWFLDTGEAGNVKLKSVLPGFITHMETVFAMTIHKSQGSEFKKIMMVLPKNTQTRLLTRELIYTGLTRAKEHAIIQTSKEVMLAASAELVERGSGVIDRLSALGS